MMGPGVEVEIGVSWLAVNFVTQRAIRSSVNIQVQEREVAFTFGFHGELNGLMDAVQEAPGSSETSVLTRATWRNNTEDTILHSHRRENLKSYRVQFISIDLHLFCENNHNLIPFTYSFHLN
jgi:hypothetical protein